MSSHRTFLSIVVVAGSLISSVPILMGASLANQAIYSLASSSHRLLRKKVDHARRGGWLDVQPWMLPASSGQRPPIADQK